MLITCYNLPFEHIVIKNFYDEDELELIWKEIDFLKPKLLGPEHTSSATDVSDKNFFLKDNTGLFLDGVYCNRNTSNIMTLNRKLWNSKITDEIIKMNYWWKLLTTCNRDSTLLNCYEENQYYKPHVDQAVITATTVLYKNDNFTGGDFVFPEYEVTIPKQNNSVIIFPSFTEHEVSPLKIKEDSLGVVQRFSITQFMYLSF